MQQWGNDTDRGKQKCSEKTPYSCHFSTTNHTRTELGSNPSLRGYRATTESLSDGTAFFRCQNPPVLVKLYSGAPIHNVKEQRFAVHKLACKEGRTLTTWLVLKTIRSNRTTNCAAGKINIKIANFNVATETITITTKKFILLDMILTVHHH